MRSEIGGQRFFRSFEVDVTPLFCRVEPGGAVRSVTHSRSSQTFTVRKSDKLSHHCWEQIAVSVFSQRLLLDQRVLYREVQLQEEAKSGSSALRIKHGQLFSYSREVPVMWMDSLSPCRHHWWTPPKSTARPPKNKNRWHSFAPQISSPEIAVLRYVWEYW